MIERYLEEFDVLPGFREGMRNVALDEQRHIGFGVKLLADLYARGPRADRRGDRRHAARGAAVDGRGGQAARLGRDLH